MLLVTPFDPSNLQNITATIHNDQGLGFNPSDDDRIVRTTDYAYDQDDIAAMTDLLHALIPTIPPVAARTDQSRTWVPFP